MHTYFLLIPLLILCWVLTKYSLLTPYISGAVAFSFGTFFYYSAEHILAIIVCFYLVSFFANQNTDPNQILSSDFSVNENYLSIANKAIKTVTFIAFILLPIPKPPGYIIGIFAFLIVYLLLSLRIASQEPGSFFTGLLGFAASAYILWFCNSLFPTANLVLPLLAGLVVFRSLDSNLSYYDLGDSYSFPGIGPFLACFIGNWVTPGFSCSSLSYIFVRSGPWQSIYAGIGSAAIEAWNLSLLFRGELSSKSPLATLLTSPDRLNHTPILDVYGMSYWSILLCVIPIIIALGTMWVDNYEVEVSPFIVIIPFCCEAVISSGLMAIPLIAVGIGISLILKLCCPYPQLQSLIIMLPMVF